MTCFLAEQYSYSKRIYIYIYIRVRCKACKNDCTSYTFFVQLCHFVSSTLLWSSSPVNMVSDFSAFFFPFVSKKLWMGKSSAYIPEKMNAKTFFMLPTAVWDMLSTGSADSLFEDCVIPVRHIQVKKTVLSLWRSRHQTLSSGSIKTSIKLQLHCSRHHLNLAYYRGHYVRSTHPSAAISFPSNEEYGYYNPHKTPDSRCTKLRWMATLRRKGIHLYQAFGSSCGAV